MNVFVFDIETVPDIASGRRLLKLDDLPDADVATAMLHHATQATGNSFVKHPLHQIVAISAVFRHGDNLSVWSLGERDSSERDLIQRFFAGIDKYTPTLVSWNGSGFDLPVLHYRALVHGITGIGYWETGDRDRDFKYNNYLNRYHARHLDLMDSLALFQSRAFAKLDEIATMLGFPGKMGIDGSQVLDYYLKGDIDTIRHYCETDVLNTYLIYLRFELIRGQLTASQYEEELEIVRSTLQGSPAAHHQAFVSRWEPSNVTC